jgi:hypothetical protein
MEKITLMEYKKLNFQIEFEAIKILSSITY